MILPSEAIVLPTTRWPRARLVEDALPPQSSISPSSHRRRNTRRESIQTSTRTRAGHASVPVQPASRGLHVLKLQLRTSLNLGRRRTMYAGEWEREHTRAAVPYFAQNPSTVGSPRRRSGLRSTWFRVRVHRQHPPSRSRTTRPPATRPLANVLGIGAAPHVSGWS
ncbi:hypothetical protein LZ30DRAFT_726534 [Colletotrichum cereale]|nr:hypothetical protein LZ30DRAFT_726534 [Colletotrichum cereale]